MLARLFLLLTITIFILPAHSQSSRWRMVGDVKWDVKSAKREKHIAMLWYEAPIMKEQTRALANSGMKTELVSEITSSRIGVVINCKTKQSGFFSVAWLNSSGVPVDSPITVPSNQIQMEEIGPETNMEGIANDACRTL